MSITIKTEKIIIRGRQRRKITSYALLKKEELPDAYFDKSEEGHCYLDTDGEIGVSSQTGINYYRMGMHLREDNFQNLLDKIKACGSRLQDINSRLAKENADWHGEETFVI